MRWRPTGRAAHLERAAPRGLLTDAAFVRLWLCGALAGVLRWLELLAISVFVLEQTGSPFLVALLTVLRMAPMFLFGIPAGALADRYDRRRLLIIGLVVLALSSAILAVLAGDRPDRRSGRSRSAPSSAASSGRRSSRSAAPCSARSPGPPRLSRAMALELATSNATRMVGPALGGVLMETLGLAGVYLLGALALRALRC